MSPKLWQIGKVFHPLWGQRGLLAEGAVNSGGKVDGPCSYHLMKGGRKEGKKGKRKRK